MKILNVYTGNLYGGLEKVLVQLMKHSDAAPDVHPEYALCFEGQLADDLKKAGAVVHMLPSVRTSRPWTVMRSRTALRAVVIANNYDLIVCHSPWPLAVYGVVAKQLGIPLAFWTHQFLEGREWDQRWVKKFIRPDFALCCSEYVRPSIQNLFPNLSAYTTYYPVAMLGTPISTEQRFNVRASLNTPMDARVILQPSRLEEWKGHRLHLKALGLLKDLPGWVLWMAGGVQRPKEQKYLDELKTIATAAGILDRVRFIGYRRDVPELMQAADIVCQPNEQPEHFGVVFVEGLASARPVVSTKMGGALEILGDKYGLLAEPTPQALADELAKVIVNQETCESIGRRGQARADELCNPQRSICHLYDVIKTELQGRR